MRDGICPRCHSETVHTKKNGLGFTRQWLSFTSRLMNKLYMPLGTKTIDHADYVCISCGLWETYLHDLNAIQDIQERWSKVPLKK
jgi:hypothetical protein